MLQRLAFEHTEDTVIEALNDLGFAGKFDAVYVPRNRRKTTNLGDARSRARGRREGVHWRIRSLPGFRWGIASGGH